MNKKQLWERLQSYNFDHVVPLTLMDKISEIFNGEDASLKAFANKIARKLNWTENFTHTAIDEYKKFIYLAMVSDFSVTPSKIIDQVWHEHLLFTKGYREFCNEVLEYNLDHNPELVPMDDQSGIFGAQYEDTLDLYQKEFNSQPPSSIWGTPKFNPKKVESSGYRSKKKKEEDSALYSDNTPLYMMLMDSNSNSSPHNTNNFDGFGGGTFGGAGAGGSFSEPSAETSVSESPSSDSTSSCSSSSCSSSCGSSCGGGGD